MSDIAFKSATDLAQMVANKEISARELLEHYLDRVDRYNEDLNAIIVDIRDEARSNADAMDSDPKATTFHGVPMTVKES